MTDWEHFKTYNLYWLYRPWLPSVKVLSQDEANDNSEFNRYPHAVGYYDNNSNTIFVRKEHDCIALRIHEHGHWFNERVFKFMEAVWEFPWWGLGLRKLFIRRSRP